MDHRSSKKLTTQGFQFLGAGAAEKQGIDIEPVNIARIFRQD
jgi:hypothetical protein